MQRFRQRSSWCLPDSDLIISSDQPQEAVRDNDSFPHCTAGETEVNRDLLGPGVSTAKERKWRETKALSPGPSSQTIWPRRTPQAKAVQPQEPAGMLSLVQKRMSHLLDPQNAKADGH